MKLKQLSEVELELLSHTDMAELILEESKKTMSTADVFKKICELLKYSEEEYTNKIGDFYTSMTTDKRFIMLDDATWDLKKKHIVPLVLDEEEEIEETEEEEDEFILEEEEDEESVEDKLNNMDDDSIDTGIDDDNDLSDLTIVDEEDLED